jgi:hypothetical protein
LFVLFLILLGGGGPIFGGSLQFSFVAGSNPVAGQKSCIRSKHTIFVSIACVEWNFLSFFLFRKNWPFWYHKLAGRLQQNALNDEGKEKRFPWRYNSYLFVAHFQTKKSLRSFSITLYLSSLTVQYMPIFFGIGRFQSYEIVYRSVQDL